MRCVEGALGLGGHVIIGVGYVVVRRHYADAIPSVESFFLDVAILVVVRLYSVIVNFICSQIIAHFSIEKTGHLRCCLGRYCATSPDHRLPTSAAKTTNQRGVDGQLFLTKQSAPVQARVFCVFLF